MERATKIAFAAAAVVVAGLVALAVPAFSGFASAEPEAPAEAVGAAAAVAPAEPAAAPELPDWAKNSGPWIIYPEGFTCQGTEGCPNDYRSLIGEPGDVLPANVEYYDPAKHDYDPANPGTFSVFPRADAGADRGPFDGANGFAVVTGGKVVSYVVAHGDTLTGISKRFSVEASALTRDDEPVIPGETQINPGDVLVLP
ncbi:LysM peptidoglycan-binding domain-containing protein [Microbacterium sp. lyk4-40-TSB-66]|uniref:LysM peptidoglycan-binding domain-containing protein n=1 Tax=Microbacterium sp. lyk4-40-TSB-66 TaxID=3040294 RepID=UPI0025515187|nr:LysM peptidoglycan-binding domain-containing protein [Microbacterium sp. lyk4-40-TSB-66]